MIAALVCIGFALLILFSHWIRHLIDEWSEMVSPSFAAPFENLLVKFCMWLATGFILFAMYKIVSWLT